MNIKTWTYIAAAILTIGLIGTANRFFDSAKTHYAHQEFKQDAIKDIVLVEQILNTVHENAESIRSLYAASDFVSYDEFTIFAKPIIERHQSIRALQWIPAVRQADLQSFVKIAQMDFPGYHVFSEGSVYDLDTLDKPWYFPTYYVHPLATNKEALGFDMGSEANRLAIIERARDTGMGAATEKMSLIQDRDQSTTNMSLLYVLPIYKGPSDTLYLRRDSLLGFVLSVIDINDLMVETGIQENTELEIELFESSSVIEQVPTHFYQSKEIHFGGLKWVLQVRHAKESYATYDWLPWMGTTLVCLIFMIFWGLVLWYRTINTRSEKIIRDKTTELTFANQLLTCIQAVQQLFIHDESPDKYFDQMLNDFLNFTDSEFGFIGRVIEKQGQSYIRTVALTNIAWDYQSRKLYRENYQQGMVFDNPDSLFGAVLKSKELVISNDPSTDPRSNGVPKGHPVLQSFVGVPFFHHDKLIGLVCLANRKGGYNQELVDKLQPYSVNCGYILEESKIKQQKQQHDDQNYTMARNDSLTQLPNRYLFKEQGKKILGLAARKKRKLAVLFIDLDDFKPVNDHFGHDMGDKLLQVVADVFRENTRSSDFIARLGGDEFAIILSDIDGPDEPRVLAQKLVSIFSEPLKVDNQTLEIGLSIGFALYPEHGKDIETLLGHADSCMYQAKKEGKNKVFDPDNRKVIQMPKNASED